MSRMCRQGSGPVLVLTAASWLAAWSSASAAEIWLASWGAGPGIAGNGTSFAVAVSADGRFVVFGSHATDLVGGGGDTNGLADAFLADRLTGTRTLISRSAAFPAWTANGTSYPAAVSADGRYVLVESTATDLVSGVTDMNGTFDLFLWDRDTNSMALVSRAENPDPSPVAANARSRPVAMSADGRFVAFRSEATDLVQGLDLNEDEDAFLWDRLTDSLTLVSHAAGAPATAGDLGSYATSLSADGRYLAFYSAATNLVAGVTDANDAEDVFLWDRDSNSSKLISHSASSTTTTANGNSDLEALAVSANGRYVAFNSYATNLVAGSVDAVGTQDAFAWDRETNLVSLVSRAAGSVATAGNGLTVATSISADGRYVNLLSFATNLVAGGSDTNSTYDVLFWDRQTGSVAMTSHVAGEPTTAANGSSGRPVISGNGRSVAFRSTALDLVPDTSDSNGGWDVYLWNRTDGSMTLASHSTVSETTAGNGPSERGPLSADGICLALDSTATDLMPGTFNGVQQVFLVCQSRIFRDGFENGFGPWSLVEP